MRLFGSIVLQKWQKKGQCGLQNLQIASYEQTHSLKNPNRFGYTLIGQGVPRNRFTTLV